MRWPSVGYPERRADAVPGFGSGSPQIGQGEEKADRDGLPQKLCVQVSYFVRFCDFTRQKVA